MRLCPRGLTQKNDKGIFLRKYKKFEKICSKGYCKKCQKPHGLIFEEIMERIVIMMNKDGFPRENNLKEKLIQQL